MDSGPEGTTNDCVHRDLLWPGPGFTRHRRPQQAIRSPRQSSVGIRSGSPGSLHMIPHLRIWHGNAFDPSTADTTKMCATQHMSTSGLLASQITARNLHVNIRPARISHHCSQPPCVSARNVVEVWFTRFGLTRMLGVIRTFLMFHKSLLNCNRGFPRNGSN